MEAQRPDIYPLLSDNMSSVQQFHIVDIVYESLPMIPYSQSQTPNSNETFPDPNSFESLSRCPTVDIAIAAPTIEPSASALSGEARDDFSPHFRVSPLNSGLWISMELIITLSQIIASVIVLSLSRHENPQKPLSVWVAGYAAGCLATLPLLYWRYTFRYAHRFEIDAGSGPLVSFGSSFSDSRSSYLALPISALNDGDHDHTSRRRNVEDLSNRNNCRFERFVENFKIALDCFFAVWFVVGNVWVFGGHSSSIEAPILYRLCIVFLTFSCIGYAMPFILCATICCCLPWILSLLGFMEDHPQVKGASSEIIASLPTFQFKAKDSKEKKLKIMKQENEVDDEHFPEGGYILVNTDKEREISADDALCCICLGNYTDGVDLRELPCTHHFHVGCVDKWLKISALCPLCKHEIGSWKDQQGPAAV